jgi:general L-amino acid transport system substrate-binding protein
MNALAAAEELASLRQQNIEELSKGTANPEIDQAFGSSTICVMVGLDK